MFSLFSLAFILVASFRLSHSKLITVTVDVQNPDPLTGAQVVYTPDYQWQYDKNCTGCPLVLDPSQTARGTWKSNLYKVDNDLQRSPRALASLRFTGNAVAVYCILPFFKSSSVQSHMIFLLDEHKVYEFKPEPIDVDEYAYDVPIYANSTMTMGDHTLTILNGLPDGNEYLMILDHITFLADVDEQSESAPPTKTNPSKVKALTGVLIAVCILFTIILAYLLYRLYVTQKRRPDSPSIIDTENLRTPTRQPSVWGWLTRYLRFDTSKRSVSFKRSLFAVGRPRPWGENFAPMGTSAGGQSQPALTEELRETQSRSRWAFVMSWRDRTIREAQIPTLPPTSHAPTTILSDPNAPLPIVRHSPPRGQQPRDAPETTRPPTRRRFTIVNA